MYAQNTAKENKRKVYCLLLKFCYMWKVCFIARLFVYWLVREDLSDSKQHFSVFLAATNICNLNY